MNKTRVRSKSVVKRKGLKTLTVWLVILFVSATLANCRLEVDDGYPDPPTYVAHIVSDVNADGDIAFSPPDTYTVSSAGATGTVLQGIDPGYSDEFRGFLNFPLRDSGGVPYYADIESATLEIFISGVTEIAAGAGVPFIIDLVSFQPSTLIASDFDRGIQPPLLSLLNDVYADDVGYAVIFDVTPLMIRAQQEGLLDLQIRMLLDKTFEAAGIFEIEDDLLDTAPLLTVAYY